jgi:hypothetical protein
MWDMWKALHMTNQQKINVHYYFEDLYTHKYVDSANMADHIATMLDIQHKITAVGEDLPDIHVARALVLLLPHTQSWEVIKIQLFNLDKLTSETVSTPNSKLSPTDGPTRKRARQLCMSRRRARAPKIPRRANPSLVTSAATATRKAIGSASAWNERRRRRRRTVEVWPTLLSAACEI